MYNIRQVSGLAKADFLLLFFTKKKSKSHTGLAVQQVCPEQLTAPAALAVGAVGLVAVAVPLECKGTLRITTRNT